MSYWIFSDIMSDDLREQAVHGQELMLPAEGLASLDRAQGPDQIAEWLKHLHPEATPETIAQRIDYYWRLSRELLPEDIVIMRIREGVAYLIGEITGNYRRDERPAGMMHLWPVKWIALDVPVSQMPAFAHYSGAMGLTEVTDEKALINLRPFVPALRKGNAGFFKWLAIIILIFELMYFWPRQ